MKILSCFVVMPFSRTEFEKEKHTHIIDEDEWTYIYDEWIKKAIESYSHEEYKISCKRSPQIPGNFVKGIVDDIANSEITIADLTGGKPNVYYELGIRHALKNGTIIISQTFENLPSDLKSYGCLKYEYSNEAHKYSKNFGNFEKNIHNQITSLINKNFPSDNPVSDFLEGIKKDKPIQTSELEENNIFGDEVILVNKGDGKVLFLSIDSIVYIKADRAYSSLFLSDGKMIVFANTLNNVLNRIKSKLITRVHRSYAVNAMKINFYLNGFLYLEGIKTPIPISKQYMVKLGLQNIIR